MKDLQKEFLPYDRALRLKALGFDEPCFGFYHIDSEEGKILLLSDNEYFMQGVEFSCNAPTFSQVFRWFREKYDLDGETCRYNLSHSEAKFLGIDITKTKHRYLVVINGEDFPNLEDMTLFISREEAELACLDKLIGIVEQKEK